MIPRRRRLLEALRLAPPSPETILHRALKACGAHLVRLPSGAVYIETRDGQRLKVEPPKPPAGQLRARELAARGINRARDEAVRRALRENTE